MEEKVYFPNSKGDKLCGILSNPTGERDFVVILCHGFSSNKNGKTYTSLVPILNKNNIASFRFDFYGHGESEGKFEDITISEAADDIRQAYKFLAAQDYKKFGLVGSSFSGITSMLAAPGLDIKFLVLRSPVSSYMGKLVAKYNELEIKNWKENGYIMYADGRGQKHKLNYPFFEDAEKAERQLSPEKILVPTLIVHGDADISVPVSQSQQTAKRIPNCRLEIIEGADHVYTQPEHFQKMIDLISDFIIKHAAAD